MHSLAPSTFEVAIKYIKYVLNPIKQKVWQKENWIFIFRSLLKMVDLEVENDGINESWTT